MHPRFASFVIGVSVFLSATGAVSGELIEIETYLNARSSASFSKDSHNYAHMVLKPGTHGSVLDFKKFAHGNVGYYITILDGPYQGKKVWVLYRPDKKFVKVLDKDNKPTEVASQAQSVQTVKHTPAVETPKAESPAEILNARAEHVISVLQGGPPVTPLNTVANSAIALTQGIGNVLLQPSVACNLVLDQRLPEATPSIEAAPACVGNNPNDPDPRRFPIDSGVGSSATVQSDSPEIIAKAQEIITQAHAVSAREKAQAIHDWVAKNISYSWSAWDVYKSGHPITLPGDALSTLHQGGTQGAVCYGYSNLYAALARAAGLKSKVVIGQICRSGIDDGALNRLWIQHAWNQVWIPEENKWVDLDTTWDSPYRDPNTHEVLSELKQTYGPQAASLPSDHRHYSFDR